MVHMGNAIMSFYSALIDLLGRCAPEMHVGFLLFLFFIVHGQYVMLGLFYAGCLVAL